MLFADDDQENTKLFGLLLKFIMFYARGLGFVKQSGGGRKSNTGQSQLYLREAQDRLHKRTPHPALSPSEGD
jgi:hypothetical protein